MKLTFTADWTNPSPETSRIAIGGYTACVTIPKPGVYEFTVLHDHLEIVGVGHRKSLPLAREAAESLIAMHAQARHLVVAQ